MRGVIGANARNHPGFRPHIKYVYAHFICFYLRLRQGCALCGRWVTTRE